MKLVLLPVAIASNEKVFFSFEFCEEQSKKYHGDQCLNDCFVTFSEFFQLVTDENIISHFQNPLCQIYL